MNSIGDKIEREAEDIIKDNNFLFAAYQNRLCIRLVHICEKYKIPVNQKIINKNIEENLINSLYEFNSEIVYKYVRMLKNYEDIIVGYVEKNESTKIIKDSTMMFVQRIAHKNKELIPNSILNNLLESMNHMIFVYDNYNLNLEVASRIKTDTKEIIDEFNRNNYNFVIETINKIIKNILSNI